DVRNALDSLFVDELGDFLLQCLLVDLIGDGIDDDRLPVPFLHVFEVRLGAHDDAPAAGTVTFPHAGHAIYDAAGGEVGRWYQFYQFVNGTIRVTQAI